MNPRYAPAPERTDPKTKQLQQLAALKQMSGGQDQQELAQRDQHGRLQAAMQLLGMQQQNENATADRALAKSRQDDLSGQYWQGDLPRQYAEQEQQKQRAQQALAAQLFSDASRFPGTDLKGSLEVAGIHDPAMAQRASEMSAQQRAQMINQVYPQLALIDDPKARELQGRTQLGKFPGAYEEALAKAFPQKAPGTAQPQVAPQVSGPGAAIHNLPNTIIDGLQSADDAMTGFGSNFWGGLLGLKPEQPQQPDTRTLQERAKASKAWPWSK